MPKSLYSSLANHGKPIMNTQEPEVAARNWLMKGGIRVTRQRMALARLLVGDGRNRHVTADMLHEAAQAAGEPVSSATVYNALHLFANVGLLREIRVGPDRSYFDTRTDDHAHFFWESEGRIEDAPDRSVDIRKLPAPPAGARIEGVDVLIRVSDRA